MLLIHVPKLTNRLGYTLKVVFNYLLHAEYSITTDAQYYLQYGDAKLSYGRERLDDGLFIKSHPLLFETTIEEQDPKAECREGQWFLFPAYGRNTDFPFDPLAAIFYMVSRYEEYLPHHEDAHGRFMACDSLAFQKGFLDQPVGDQWARMIKMKILERYPDYEMPRQNYLFEQTIDVDAAWCYLHKGIYRTTVGLFRDFFARRDYEESARRLRVLTHKEADPFDTFDYLLDMSQRAPGSHLFFFTLLSDYGPYDKPASYLNRHMRELVQHLDDYAKMGIHPSYNTLEHPELVDKEIKRLEDIIHRPIIRSRFHFLRFRLPMSYRVIKRAGISDDFSMGYADAVGFRAGISVPYPFYDLERDHEIELIIHPFSIMDATLQNYLKLKPEEGLEQYKRLIDNVRAVDGTFCCVVHNQNLSEFYGWAGWRDVYEKMVDYAR
jgi:hypothetical protein